MFDGAYNAEEPNKTEVKRKARLDKLDLLGPWHQRLFAAISGQGTTEIWQLCIRLFVVLVPVIAAIMAYSQLELTNQLFSVNLHSDETYAAFGVSIWYAIFLKVGALLGGVFIMTYGISLAIFVLFTIGVTLECLYKLSFNDFNNEMIYAAAYWPFRLIWEFITNG